jgi:hypothetical protein
VWIATGAIAAVLALVALGATVPHWMKAHAAGSTASSAAGSVGEPTAATPVATAIPPADNPAAGSPVATPASTQGASPQTPGLGSAPTPGSRPAAKAQLVAPVSANGGPAANRSPAAAANAAAPIIVVNPSAPAAPPGPSPEEIAQVHDRWTDISARAETVHRGVQQIRSQQEQMGLGLRGDMESAESRLDTYMRAADSDLQRGNITAATQDLNKAEPELKTLERFLGH